MLGRLVNRAAPIAAKFSQTSVLRPGISRMFADTKIPYTDRLRRQKDVIIDGLIDTLQEKKQKRLLQAAEEKRFPKLKGLELPAEYYRAKQLPQDYPTEVQRAMSLVEYWQEHNRKQSVYIPRKVVASIVHLARLVEKETLSIVSRALRTQRLEALRDRDWDLFLTLLYTVQRHDTDRKKSALSSVLQFFEVPSEVFYDSATDLTDVDAKDKANFYQVLFALDKDDLALVGSTRLAELGGLESRDGQLQAQTENRSGASYTGKSMEVLQKELESEASEELTQEQQLRKQMIEKLPITREDLQKALAAAMDARSLFDNHFKPLDIEGLPVLKYLVSDQIFECLGQDFDEMLVMAVSKLSEDRLSAKMIRAIHKLANGQEEKPQLFGPLKTRTSRNRSASKAEDKTEGTD